MYNSKTGTPQADRPIKLIKKTMQLNTLMHLHL